MQVFIAYIGKALVGAIPALTEAAWSKIILPLVSKIKSLMDARKQKKENEERAQRLKDAKNKTDIDSGFGDMP